MLPRIRLGVSIATSARSAPQLDTFQVLDKSEYVYALTLLFPFELAYGLRLGYCAWPDVVSAIVKTQLASGRSGCCNSPRFDELADLSIDGTANSEVRESRASSTSTAK